jgi:DNA repair protein RecO (recombination protein O)
VAHQIVRGFVIREVQVGEYDRIINILSAGLGLITASARGARRTKSHLLLATQVFSYSEFTLFANKGHYSVNDAEVIEPFIALHQDLDRLVCASHLAEVLLDCTRDDVAQPELYRLWAYTLQALQSQPDPLLTVHIAQMRLLAIIGFAPLLDCCVACGGPVDKQPGFSLQSCGLVCGQSSCRRQAGDARPVSPGTASSLHHCLDAPLARLFNCRLGSQSRLEFIQLSELYLTKQMEKKYTRLQLLNGLADFGEADGKSGGDVPKETANQDVGAD